MKYNRRRKRNKSDRQSSRRALFIDIRHNVKSASRRDRFVAFGKLALLIIILITVPVLLYIFYKDTFFNAEALIHLPATIVDNKLGAGFLLFVLQIFQMVFCILPGQPIQIATSYIFGFWLGMLLTLSGAVAGTLITYFIASFLGKGAMHLIFGKNRVNDYISKLNSKKAYTIIFIIYLIPGIPKDIVSYVAGISEVRLLPFLIISTVGRIPGVAGSLLVGKFTQTHNYVGLTVVAAVYIAIFLVVVMKKDLIMDWIDSFEDKVEKKLSLIHI